MRTDRRPSSNNRRSYSCTSKNASLFEKLVGDASAVNVDAPLLAALPRNRWLLASLLQKSIRRGRTDYAAAAAVMLADLVPEYVAKRLPVIAYEDIGIAAPGLLLWVKHTAASLPFLPADDRREVAALVAHRLAESVKSRTACDIVSLMAATDETAGHARDLLQSSAGKWIAEATDRKLPVLRRAVALHFCLGLSVSGLPPMRSSGHESSVLPTLATSMNLPAAVTAAVHAGKQTHNLHAALPLAYDLLHAGGPITIKTEPCLTRPSAEGDGLPLCSIDMFTRCGRTAYRMLARAEGDLALLLQKTEGKTDPAAVIGILLFQVEGSLLDRALVSPESEELLATVETQEARQVGVVSEPDAKALRLWLRRNVELVDRCRIAALATYLRPAARESI